MGQGGSRKGENVNPFVPKMSQITLRKDQNRQICHIWQVYVQSRAKW